VTDGQSITARALRSLLWVISSVAVLALLRLLCLMILSRLLGPGTFGLMSAAFVVVGLSYVISDMGVGYALVQRRDIDDQVFGTAITVSLATGIILYGLAWAISEPISVFFGQPELSSLLRALAIVFPLRSLSVPTDAALQRNLAFGTIVRVDVTAYFFGYFLPSIGLALAGYEIWALGGAFLGEAVVRTALLLWLSPHKVRLAFDREAARSLMHFGTGVTITRIANYLALQGDKIVVGRMLGTPTLGVYERAYQLMVMPANMLGQVVGRVLFPAAARVQDRAHAMRSTYRRSLSLTALITLPASAIIVVLDRELVLVVLGRAWESAVPAFEILGSVLLFRTSYKITGEVIRAAGAVYAEAWRQMLYAAAVLAGGLIGSAWGLTGVAAGVAAAIVLNTLLMTQLGCRLTGLRAGEVVAAHGPALLISIIVGIASAAAAALARQAGLGDLLICVTGGSTGLLAATVTVYFRPHVLGPDGRWLLEAVDSHAPRPVARLVAAVLRRW
jgi:PST family polysaccharide transporter